MKPPPPLSAASALMMSRPWLPPPCNQPKKKPQKLDLTGVPEHCKAALEVKFEQCLAARKPKDIDDMPAIDAETGYTHAATLLAGWRQNMVFR